LCRSLSQSCPSVFPSIPTFLHDTKQHLWSNRIFLWIILIVLAPVHHLSGGRGCRLAVAAAAAMVVVVVVVAVYYYQ
jgi:hypothetical protein